MPSGETTQKYGYLGALLFSWFSLDFYRDVARNWPGWGLRYMGLIVLLSWTPFTARLAAESAIAGVAMDEVTADFPPMTIRRGVVTSDVEQPYEWSVGGEKWVLDTVSEAPQIGDAKILIGRDFVEVERDIQVSRYSLAGVDELDVNADTAGTYIGLFLGAILVIGMPLAVTGHLGWRLFMGLIYGRLVAMGASTSFEHGYRAAAVAITPVMLLGALWSGLTWHPPLWSVIGELILGLYLALAIAGFRRSEQAVRQ